MLRLIRKDETVEVAVGGTTFVVKLQSYAEARALRLRHSSKGRVDEEALALDLWKRHLVGWRDLANADGEVIPFDAGLVPDVINNLPDDVIMLLTMRIREPQAAHAKALGNSLPSSASAS